MESFKVKPVKYSKNYAVDTEDIYNYSIETFGVIQASSYEATIDQLSNSLSNNYLMYPECRHIPTKNRIYRNIILESHLIIYRITSERIEVLRVLHAHSSIAKIRGVRNVKI